MWRISDMWRILHFLLYCATWAYFAVAIFTSCNLYNILPGLYTTHLILPTTVHACTSVIKITRALGESIPPPRHVIVSQLDTYIFLYPDGDQITYRI